MTDKEKLDKLVAEIKRRYKECKGATPATEYQELLDLIESMQEEPVSENLEEVCEQLAENARKHKAETSSPFFSPTDYKQGVIDGANWQKEQMINKGAEWLRDCLDNGLWVDQFLSEKEKEAVVLTYKEDMEEE